MYYNTPFFLIPPKSSFQISWIDLTVLKVSNGWSWRPEVSWPHMVGTQQAMPVASQDYVPILANKWDGWRGTCRTRRTFALASLRPDSSPEMVLDGWASLPLHRSFWFIRTTEKYNNTNSVATGKLLVSAVHIFLISGVPTKGKEIPLTRNGSASAKCCLMCPQPHPGANPTDHSFPRWICTKPYTDKVPVRLAIICLYTCLPALKGKNWG